MDDVVKRMRQLGAALRSVFPVLADLAGIALAVLGAYRLETGAPGIYLLVAAAGCIVIGFVTQDVS